MWKQIWSEIFTFSFFHLGNFCNRIRGIARTFSLLYKSGRLTKNLGFFEYKFLPLDIYSCSVHFTPPTFSCIYFHIFLFTYLWLIMTSIFPRSSLLATFAQNHFFRDLIDQRFFNTKEKKIWNKSLTFVFFTWWWGKN